MSAFFWLLTKFALAMAMLWGLFMVFSAFGIDLLLRGEVRGDDLGMGLFWSGVLACTIGLLVNPFPWRKRREARDPTAQLLIKPPVLTIYGMIAGLVSMAASCAYVLATGPFDGLAVAGLVVFGTALMGLPVFLRTTTIRLSPQGFNYSGFACGSIPWPDIESVEADCVFRTFIVTLRLRDEEKYTERELKGIGPRRRWVRQFLGSPFSIPTIMFNVSPDWLRRAIQVRLDHFGVSTPSHPTIQRQGAPA
jgi:hypothetical protein